MSQGLVSITDTNKSTIAKRKTAPKPKLKTHHKKANFWNCNSGLLWQQGKYSSNGFAQMHLQQRGGAIQWIISLQCIAMALSDKVVSSVQKRVKAQRGLASNCPPCVRSFKEQRWHWGEIVKIQKSSISPLHLFSICKSAVVTNLSNLIQGNCPGWPLPPPTSLCLRESLPFNPPAKTLLSSTGCGGTAPNTHESSREPTIPVKSNLGKPRISSAFQGSSFKLLGKFFLCKFSGRIFKDMLQLLVWAWKEGLGWAEPPRKPRCHLISCRPTSAHANHCFYIEHCKCLILCHPTSAHATSPSGSHCSCIAHVLTFPWVGFVSYIFTAQRLGLAVTVRSLLLCRWLWLLSNLGRNRLVDRQTVVHRCIM